ncbi:MAG: hypothetical protein K6E20_06590 [Acholeplasmatales bacterium]|nr:hypothetical protein [Acholeplasmatales bacterium]
MDFYVDDYKQLINDNDYTKAINQAISDASLNNGRVIFKENKLYRSGTIYLKDNIELYFEKNSCLKALDDIESFNVNNIKIKEGLEVNTFINCDYDGKPYLYFIYGFGLNNIKFSGAGIIDGNEKIFYGQVEQNYIEGKFYPRMPLIYIENSKDINIKNITLTHSAFWTVHLVGSSDIVIDSIKILNNRKMLNADGIDPDHSKNILIKDCYIESADDCIVFKGTKENIKYGNCENIEVRNCTLKSTSAAIKIGTETYAEFNNINISDVKILDTNRGISLMMRDGGVIHNVKFNNIDIQTHLVDPNAFWGKGEAIAITNVKRTKDSKDGLIYDIEFNNININSEHGIFMYGDNNIKDITFNTLDLKLNNITTYRKNIYDLRPNINNVTFDDDLAELYLHNVKNIIINDNKNKNYKIINHNSTFFVENK